MIYPVLLLGFVFVALPWLPVSNPVHLANWFPGEQRYFSILIVLLTSIIILLTIVAFFFRGANWSLIF
jgi:hypothetical protein